MQDMHDQERANTSRMNFITPFKSECNMLVTKPTKAKGIKQYPTVLTINIKDLNYVSFTPCCLKACNLYLLRESLSKRLKKR